MTLCSAQGVTPYKKTAELRVLSEADRDAVEAREYFWSCLSPPSNAQRTIVRTERVIILNPVEVLLTFDSRQTKNNLDNLEESISDDLWNIDGTSILSASWSGSTRFRILGKRPPKVHLWVDSRPTQNQVTSRLGEVWPEVFSLLSKGAQKESKAAVGQEKITSSTTSENHDIPPDEVEEQDAIVRNARAKLEMPVEPATAVRYTKHASRLPRHHLPKLQCQKTLGGDPWHQVKCDPSLTKSEMQLKTFQRYDVY